MTGNNGTLSDYGTPGTRPRRQRLRLAVTALVGAGLLATAAPAASATSAASAQGAPADGGPSPTAGSGAARVDRGALDAAVAAMVKQGGASAALGAVREGSRPVWRGAAGTSEVATGAPVDENGRFRIGSVTKAFVSTVVLQLAGEHRLGLDDPIERLLPGEVPNGAAITVRQLLNHTSGLPNHTGAPAFDFSKPDWAESGRWKNYRAQDLVDIANTFPPSSAPGAAWSYSNTNYVLAGMIIEKVTGHPWNEEVERRIIRPLRLTHTSMPVSSPFVPGPHAHGYLQLPTGPVDVTLENPSWAGPAGSGISTTADLNRFIAGLLGGKLLRPAELAEMQRTTGLGDGKDYGLGLMRYDTPCGLYWGLTGGIPGYSTGMFGSADGRRQFAVSVNFYDVSDREALGKAWQGLVDAGTCAGLG
ncbi:serine hydrolase domain-containing protein [Kitasatospora sp. NPDC058032]|uniref:serine hydrolase domain-containing protein n=1 Tax=Kitasatospora sp. NPDC058032 TaxID=3346307 RepID=UPI0036DF81A8